MTPLVLALLLAADPVAPPDPVASPDPVVLAPLVRAAPPGDLVVLVAADPRLRGLDGAGRERLLAAVAEPRKPVASVLNVIPGFGLGSLTQGDRRGYGLLAADAVAIFLAVNGARSIELFDDRSNDSAGAQMIAGFALFGVSRLAGALLPLTFRGRTHGALERAFDKLDSAGVELAPAVATQDGAAPGATVRLKF